MYTQTFSIWSNWRYDIPAAVVVSLVALPLCLGVALASGAPLISGLIAGIVGGIVVGSLSKSSLSISGPAAGLTVIVFDAIQSLPSFEAFLLAVMLAGILQCALGVCRAGVIGDFIPNAVIKGMLAAIGLILILKQIPHAVGYDTNPEGDFGFFQRDGHNTFSTLWHMLQAKFSLAAIAISGTSLAFLAVWDKKQPGFTNWLRYLPGPLLVVLFGVAANAVIAAIWPGLHLSDDRLVNVPVTNSLGEIASQLRAPDFSLLHDRLVWITAVTLALVASVETLLSIEAVDKLDPFKRTTPTSRELLAQGVGNIGSSLIGGLPVTSVIVRSSANVSSGARTQMSSILHGVILLVCVLAIPLLLNQIPLAALAAILISVGYKLTKPAIFRMKYDMGIAYFVPFVVTILAILFTDLLIGIAIGVAVGVVFLLAESIRSVLVVSKQDGQIGLLFRKDLYFIHKYVLKRVLSNLPNDRRVLIDLSRVNYIDLDNIEIINDFLQSAKYRDITVTIKQSPGLAALSLLREPAIAI